MQGISQLLLALLLLLLVDALLNPIAVAGSEYTSVGGEGWKFKISYETTGPDAVSSQDYVEAIAIALDNAYDWYKSKLPSLGFTILAPPQVEIKDKASIVDLCVKDIIGGQYCPLSNKIFFDKDDLWPSTFKSLFGLTSDWTLQEIAGFIAAHELFHWVQDKEALNYSCDLALPPNCEPWIFEGSARWIEGPIVGIHPLYDSYELSVPLKRQVSAIGPGYSAWQFWHYLSSLPDGLNKTLKIIRRVLPQSFSNDGEDPTVAVLGETGRELSDVFTEFAIAVVRQSQVGNSTTGTFTLKEDTFQSQDLAVLPTDETKSYSNVEELSTRYRRLEWKGTAPLNVDVSWDSPGGPISVAILRDQINGGPLVTEIIPNSSTGSHSVLIGPNIRLTVLLVNGAGPPKDISLRLVKSNPTNATPLTNGVPKTDNVAQGAWKLYSFNVPSGATSLKVTTINVSGDVDLYVKFNQVPTDSFYDCRPFSASGNETCDFHSCPN